MPSAKYSFLLLSLCFTLSFAKWGFLLDRMKCNIKCENGGVCAFDIENRERHKCLCFTGMYEGDRCQYTVTTTIEPPTTTTSTSTQTLPPIFTSTEEVTSEELRTKELKPSRPIVPAEATTQWESLPVSQSDEDNAVTEESSESSEEVIEVTSTDSALPDYDPNTGHYYEPDNQLDLNRQNSKTTYPVEEPDSVVEEEDGWSYVKRKKGAATSSSLATPLAIAALLIGCQLL